MALVGVYFGKHIWTRDFPSSIVVTIHYYLGFYPLTEDGRSMKAKLSSLREALRCLLALICVASLLPSDLLALSLHPKFVQAPAAQTVRIPPDQLDSLVAPIALYPDPLLAQVLAASTYPLEIIQAQQWLATNPGLKDQALADAVAKEPWDPSVQALVALPEVVK